MNGVWRLGPGLELFTCLQAQLGEVPILAEDLGIITSDVVQLRCGTRAGEGGGEAGTCAFVSASLPGT